MLTNWVSQFGLLLLVVVGKVVGEIRRTGIYWWSHHIRGDAKLGTIHKVYRVRR